MAFDIISLLPVASVNGALWMFIESLIVAAVVVFADRIIAHEMEVKHAVIVSIAAFFAIPFLMSAALPLLFFNATFNIIFFYGLPLLVWILLAEAFLSGADHKTKIELAFVAWIVYLFVGYVGIYTGIPAMLNQYIPF
jgi:hypothetical protein